MFLGKAKPLSLDGDGIVYQVTNGCFLEILEKIPSRILAWFYLQLEG